NSSPLALKPRCLSEFSFFSFIVVLFYGLLKYCLTPGGFAKCFAFRKTFRCTKSLKGLRTAKPPGDVAEARRDFATSVWRLAQWRISEHKTVNTPQKLMRGRMFN